MDGKWLSVLEYASFKKKSISTVRRYIKANRVKFKEDNGKYLIWTKNYSPDLQEKEIMQIKFENERLKKENLNLKDQVAEMSMLVKIYEDEKKRSFLPDLPNLP